MDRKKLSPATAKELEILTLSTGVMRLYIVGTSPLVFNALSEKAKHELLLPKGRKTTADRAANLKHDVLPEYRNSIYGNVSDEPATRLMFPTNALKKAAMSAALDLPGVKKAEIGRLLWPHGNYVNVYGVPQLYMTMVRSADINHTPDIRTRAILPEWALTIEFEYVRPKLGDAQLANLFAAAGMLSGIGDGRQEKGALNFGQFHLVDPDSAAYKRIVKTGGRVEQDKALQAPSYYDLETQKLFTWYQEEVQKMGDRLQPRRGKRPAADATVEAEEGAEA